ncbi:MAG: hypothetical protein ABR980_08800 [Ignavibacteriaceae bacterium]|jgi:hypothetical protein
MKQEPSIKQETNLNQETTMINHSIITKGNKMKNKNSVKQLKPNNEELKITEVLEDDSIISTDENYYDQVNQSYIFQYFIGSLKQVLSEEGKSSDDIMGVHIIRALFKMQNVENGKQRIDQFLAEYKDVIEEFKEFSRLAEEGKLNWGLMETLNPGYLRKHFNENYKTFLLLQ